ncbi:MAG: redox-sensing transcriptional repressor Rex [Bacteroidetes bacterium]|nr:redox-sensing transcriptional repressor Rex [Bacteroidota bacterium]
MERISKAAFRRLPRYHQILSAYESVGKEFISSRELSEILEINETLVRKDMADLRIRGRQNQGYGITALRVRIENFLGLQEITETLVVGAGNLGTALATYAGFSQYGLKIVGMIDSDPDKVFSTVGEHTIHPVSRLGSLIRKRDIKMIILTVPLAAAQEVTDVCVEAGVRAIWNFTPCELQVPPGVKVRNEQIIGGFMALSYYLKNLAAEEGNEEKEA